MEVLPDPEWFDRIRAGWAQFDRDLAEYELPAAVPALVAEPVEALPAVVVRISGQIDVQDNFKVFERALREFLDNKLIREPKTDQEFIDLDQQIKAMKKAEEVLDRAESMMLAQIQSVDEAKRQKDMLAKLVRDNRLMAERLLETEKKRRREELVETARKAFSAHVAALQGEITGARLEVKTPDFAAVIKGLKTFTSMQDKLDAALANGKIAADKEATDLHAKLDWVEQNASDYRALLADMQQLVAKPKPVGRMRCIMSTVISQPIYVELEALEALTTLSASTIQNMVARSEFPAPRELSSRRVGWLYREVMEWAENRPVSTILPPPNTGARKSRRATASQVSQGSSTGA